MILITNKMDPITLALALVVAVLLVALVVFAVVSQEHMEEKQHEVDLMQAKLDGYMRVLDQEVGVEFDEKGNIKRIRKGGGLAHMRL